jgi:hypothetical protein
MLMKKPGSKESRKRYLKVFLVSAIPGFLMRSVLSRLGGNSYDETRKQGIQEKDT